MALIRRPPQKFNFLVSYKNASSRIRHLIGRKLSVNAIRSVGERAAIPATPTLAATDTFACCESSITTNLPRPLKAQQRCQARTRPARAPRAKSSQQQQCRPCAARWASPRKPRRANRASSCSAAAGAAIKWRGTSTRVNLMCAWLARRTTSCLRRCYRRRRWERWNSEPSKNQYEQ